MKSLRALLIVASAAMVASTSAALPARADTIAFNENAAPNSTPAGTGLVGFEFTVNQNIDLTQLGFYAQSIGGGDSPTVSLFNVTGGFTASPTPMYQTPNLVGSVPTEPGWNYVSVGTPILLTVGNTYAVTAPLYFSEQYNSTAAFTYGSAISTPTYLLDAGWNGWSNSSYNFTSLAPTSPGANLSANFQYTLAPVIEAPEPSTYALLGLGLSVLLLRLRRRASVASL
jgi:hypothetical protein